MNGNKTDINQDAINLRFNAVLYNPEKISSSQAEYSFEISFPDTPNNSKIFDYANNYAKLNKFRARFDAVVYADGKPIFTGTLTLNSYKDKQFNCNLVQVKVYSLDEIFEEDTLTKIPWMIDFDGISTINERNAMEKTDVVFPLVNYGPFQKKPENSDSVARDYTSKYIIDKWNKWYVESFYPSLNMLESIKKAFEYKGYTVGGDAFIDPILKNIYMSCNLADEQVPVYNLGNPHFGKVELNVTWSTPQGTGYTPYIQSLKFPYFRVGNDENYHTGDTSYYNFNEIQTYDILEEGNVSATTYQYMYQPYEHLIVIPADGFYKINLNVSAQLDTSSSFTAEQYVRDSSSDIVTSAITLTPSFNEITPLEIQLVRNYDDSIELIKGKWNKYYRDGNPNNSTYLGGDNMREWKTCFPHEAPKCVTPLPTKMNSLTTQWTPNIAGDWGDWYADRELMCYDPAVSPSFICGFSSMGKLNDNGCAAALKNGYSWSKMEPDKNDSFYQQSGYNWSIGDGWYEERGDLNKNTYINAPFASFSTTLTSMTGSVSMLVKLNRGDRLQLFAVQRSYDNDGNIYRYQTTINAALEIEAYSDRNYQYLLSKSLNDYNNPTMFPEQLNLSEFMNKEKKISEYIQNILDAFNLELLQYDKSVEINVKKKFGKNSFNAINIDDRVNKGEISVINYPKSMAVKYKIDTEEHGFYDSIPEEHKNDNDRDKYGDSGYTKIILNDDSYVTTTSDKNLQYSYTWYDNFEWIKVDTEHTEDSGTTTTLSLPVICKEDYMADYANYEEDMKHDGYGLAQRFWFKPTMQPYVDPQMHSLPTYLYTDTYPQEKVDIYTPVNIFENVNLSYKNSEVSLLTTYFNITPYLGSNYVTVEAYISPEEYNQIKNGAMIEFDDDLYYVVEISGFDASGKNETELKLLKRV